jgi:hypothetical protein
MIRRYARGAHFHSIISLYISLLFPFPPLSNLASHAYFLFSHEPNNLSNIELEVSRYSPATFFLGAIGMNNSRLYQTVVDAFGC